MLSFVIAPHKALQSPAHAVDPLAHETHILVEELSNLMISNQLIGINAPMVGISLQIMVIDQQEASETNILKMMNPEIIDLSSETQVIDERSPCFPGMMAPIKRPREIVVKYQDLLGINHEIKKEGLIATAILHQFDNLHGKSFLDHLSPLKKSLLIKKMEHAKKNSGHHHIHGPHCSHG